MVYRRILVKLGMQAQRVTAHDYLQYRVGIFSMAVGFSVAVEHRRHF